MISTKARLVNFLMRNRHLFKGKLKKEKFDFNTSIKKFREDCEKGAKRFGKLPESISIENETIAGINSEWVIPENSDNKKLIFYVHGGGYVSGSLNDHRAVVSKIADLTRISLLHFEYRLAPEFPFPQALNDSISVYNEILNKGYKPDNIVFMGESAGGGLALALLLALKKEKIELPKAAAVISPWTDLSLSGDPYKSKNNLSVAPLDSWKVFSSYYCGENNPENPLISPLFGDLAGLPPLYINSAENDELFDDGKSFYEKALSQGVSVEFKAGYKMVHCYPLLAPLFIEAEEAMNEIVEFILKHLQINKH